MTSSDLALALVVDNDGPTEDLKRTALTWPERAKALRVVDGASYSQAADTLKTIKGLRKQIAESYKPIKQRIDESKRAVLDEERKHDTPLAEAETTIKGYLVAWDTEMERLRQIEQKRLQEEARLAEEQRRLEEAAALEAEAIRTGDAEMAAVAEEIMATPVAVQVVSVPKATPVVSGVSFREQWKFRIVNPALIPREYLSVNEVAIGAVVRALKGTAKIPGVEVYAERIASASGR